MQNFYYRGKGNILEQKLLVVHQKEKKYFLKFCEKRTFKIYSHKTKFIMKIIFH